MEEVKWNGRGENGIFIRHWQKYSRIGKKENEEEEKNENEVTN